METYRSGHNGADSKSVREQSHEGSNPSVSAKKKGQALACPFFLATEGFEEAGIAAGEAKNMPATYFLGRGRIHSLMNAPGTGVGIRLSFAAEKYSRRNIESVHSQPPKRTPPIRAVSFLATEGFEEAGIAAGEAKNMPATYFLGRGRIPRHKDGEGSSLDLWRFW